MRFASVTSGVRHNCGGLPLGLLRECVRRVEDVVPVACRSTTFRHSSAKSGSDAASFSM
jgi:hypothetical protein